MPRRSPPPSPPPPEDLGPVWEADLAPVSISFGDDRAARPALLLVVVDGYILSFEIISRPSAVPAEIAALLADAIRKGIAIAGHAPEIITVRHASLAAPLASLLRAEGIEVDVARTLPGVEEALVAFDARFVGARDASADAPRPRGSSPQTWAGWGLPSEQIGRLFAAGAAYYRAAPWKNITNEDVVRLTVRGGAAWSASVMGMAGEIYGLALYARHADLVALLRGDPARPRDSLRDITGTVLSFTFSPRAELSTAMRREIRAARWEVAGLAAFPHLFTLNTPGGGVTAREMDDLVVALSVIPPFARANEPTLAGRAPQRYPIAWKDPDGAATIKFDGARDRLG